MEFYGLSPSETAPFIKMEEKIEVFGAPVVSTNEKPPPYNPLNRPTISYKWPIIGLIFYITSFVGMLFIPDGFVINKWIIIAIFTIIFAILVAKRAIIWSIHLYQNKASDKTRLRCVFEPSCSEYMIMAINKYGTVRGVIKGIKRLMRCHPPNGGKDYP